MRRPNDLTELLVTLSRTLRPLADPSAIQVEATRFLGRYLGVNRAVYGEAEEDGEHVVVERDYTDGVASAAGRYRVEDFGSAVAEAFAQGYTLVVADMDTEPGLTDGERATFRAVEVRAYVGVFLARGGRPAATLSVHQAEARQWTRSEVALVEATGALTWEAVERARVEAALRESRARLDFVLESSRIGFWNLDLVTGQARTSLQHDRCFGATEPFETWDYDTFLRHVHPDDRGRVDGAFRQAIAERGDWHFESRVIWPDGSVHWIEAHGSHYLSVSGRATQMVGTVADITRRKQNELALQEINESLEQRVEDRTKELRALAGQLTLAEAKERQRLAQVLHDDLQQQLYAVQFVLREVRESVAGGRVPDAVAALDTLGGMIRESVQTSRRATTDLSPPVLGGEGLTEALRWLAGDLEERHGLRVEVLAAGDLSVPHRDIRSLLFNLVRELLFNVVKHAGVPRARVLLRDEGEQFVIAVIDEGRGFRPESISDSDAVETGFGLHSVRERLSYFGGRLDVASAPGEGTRVTVRLPRSSLRMNEGE